MELQHDADGFVRVWWGDRWGPGPDGETVEFGPSLVLTEHRANAFVVEMLRGPMGPVGSMGLRGYSAHHHVHQIPGPMADITSPEQEL
jgi:hypothetical protein